MLWTKALLVLIATLLAWTLYKKYKYFVKELKHVTYLNYSSDLGWLVDQLKLADSIAYVRELQKALDDLYAAAFNHCQSSILEEEFNEAYILLMEKLIDQYEDEVLAYEEQESAKDTNNQ